MPEKEESVLSSEQRTPLERVIRRILSGVMYAGMGAMLVLMLLTVIHATGRYGLNMPIMGLVEISSFLLVIIIFSSGAYTEVERAHITIGTIVDTLSDRTQAIIDSISYIFSLGLCLVAFWYTIKQAMFYYDERYTSMILGILHFPFVLYVAIGWITLAAAIFLRLLRFLPRAVRRSS